MTSDVVAEFLKKGGKVVKAPDVIPVTGQEVLAYLLGCGFRAKYISGDAKPYQFEGKRYSMAKLVVVANVHRTARQLPPFALRVNIGSKGGRVHD